jgi:hypothetical protein
VLEGEVALPAGATSEPFVDADDIADVAVAALTDDRHIGELYELTGPRLLSFAEPVQEIAEATGREIRYVPSPLDAFASEMAARGIPDDLVDLLTYLFSEVLDGRNAHLADGVERALGRPPRDFRDYVRETAASACGTLSSVAKPPRNGRRLARDAELGLHARKRADRSGSRRGGRSGHVPTEPPTPGARIPSMTRGAFSPLCSLLARTRNGKASRAYPPP